MSSIVEIQHQFHSVGQGLFASGSIKIHDPSFRKFRWVYDCGTTSSQSHLDEALGNAGLGPYVDLVTISHFDKDHISGMVRLLMRTQVQDLLLPFMPLWQRLILMVEEGVTLQDQLGRFLIDPVGFISEIPQARVKRILFVTPAAPPRESEDSTGPSGDKPLSERRAESRVFRAPPEKGDSPPGVDERLIVDVDIVNDAALPADDERRRYKEETRGASGIEIQYIAEGSSLTVSDLWEFVPYNDGELAGIPTRSFIDKVEVLRTTLLSAPDPMDKEVALYDLKKVYVKCFGKSSKERNVISLFLYAGPLGENCKWSSFTESIGRQKDKEYRVLHREMYLWNSSQGGILYTGDGYLDKKARFDKLSEHLGENRLEQVSVFQVMHHGSRNNWFSGVAAKISPEYSVFSSDPSHRGYGHPHAEVLRDFWKFGPIQVDKHCSVEFNHSIVRRRC